MSNATWKAESNNSDWNNPDNWEPKEVPSSTATFNQSKQASITFTNQNNVTINTIEFGEEASSYTLTFGTSTAPWLTISGTGVQNHSYKQQSFIVAATSSGFAEPQLKFNSNAIAGNRDTYYCAGPVNKAGYGGGVIRFEDNSSAGSATFKAWTGAGIPPKQGSTVGGEISFGNNSTADNATFIIYGSLGVDGDTFGNVVFHDQATAANASFSNIGGTVSGGDGGNTQFYGTSTAAYGIYNNWGGTHEKANGGDVAFDATATGDHGYFYNHAAKAANAYGGVTSFNNNWPYMDAGQGANAGNGHYVNYGARSGEQGGGGHLEFSARFGSPSGANANIANYGSAISGKSTAGHTVFSINTPTKYFPTAGNATVTNHPAASAEGAAGFTTFSIYSDSNNTTESTPPTNVPTAGKATLINLGGTVESASGGYTCFSNNTSAGSATLIAYGGTNGGYGGRIEFYDQSTGDSSTVKLYDNGELDLSYHNGGLSIGRLDVTGGSINIQLGTSTTNLSVEGNLDLYGNSLNFSFYGSTKSGFAFNTSYTVFGCKNLSDYTASQFSANSIEGVEPTFAINNSELTVSYNKV